MDLETIKSLTSLHNHIGYEVRGSQPRVHVYRVIKGPFTKTRVKTKTLKTKKQAHAWVAKKVNA